MILNFWSSCLPPHSSGIKAQLHPSWFIRCGELNLGLYEQQQALDQMNHTLSFQIRVVSDFTLADYNGHQRNSVRHCASLRCLEPALRFLLVSC